MRPVSSASGMNSAGPTQAALGVAASARSASKPTTLPARAGRRSAGSGRRARRGSSARCSVGARSRAGSTAAARIALVEQLARGPAVLLGPVHRGVGVAEQRLGRRAGASATAMPMLALERTPRRPSSANGSASASSRRRRGDRRSALVGRRGRRSSDHELVATEAGDGVAGAQRARGAGARPCTSSSSPASWPRLSLTTLKWSRSRNSTAAASGAAPAQREGRSSQNSAGWGARSAGRAWPGGRAGCSTALRSTAIDASGADHRHDLLGLGRRGTGAPGGQTAKVPSTRSPLDAKTGVDQHAWSPWSTAISR